MRLAPHVREDATKTIEALKRLPQAATPLWKGGPPVRRMQLENSRLDYEYLDRRRTEARTSLAGTQNAYLDSLEDIQKLADGSLDAGVFRKPLLETMQAPAPSFLPFPGFPE